jgi:hypothetical protein
LSLRLFLVLPAHCLSIYVYLSRQAYLFIFKIFTFTCSHSRFFVSQHLLSTIHATFVFEYELSKHKGSMNGREQMLRNKEARMRASKGENLKNE